VRYDDDEVARLYDDYRGEAYFEVRHRHEPFYTRAANRALGSDDDVNAARRDALRGFLARYMDGLPLEAVLDHGGDRGQIIPEGIASRRFVYDVSGVPPVAGVDRISTLEDLKRRSFDLVLSCHVIEHVPEPFDTIMSLTRLITPGGYLYVEVPLERPSLALAARSRIGNRWLDALTARPLLLRLADIYSTAFRVKFGFVPPMGFVKAHEHINFFTPRSMKALLERAGLEVVASEVQPILHALGDAQVIVTLARRRGQQS
jgi:SAM-dependent methyltransferase